jgi:hypothetical protein
MEQVGRGLNQTAEEGFGRLASNDEGQHSGAYGQAGSQILGTAYKTLHMYSQLLGLSILRPQP